MYDDLWMAQNGFMDMAPEKTTAGDLLASLGREGKLIYLLPGDSLQTRSGHFSRAWHLATAGGGEREDGRRGAGDHDCACAARRARLA